MGERLLDITRHPRAGPRPGCGHETVGLQSPVDAWQDWTALFMKLGDFPVLPGPASSLPAAWSRPSGWGLERNVDSSECNLSRLLSGGPGGAQVPLDVLDSQHMWSPWESTARSCRLFISTASEKFCLAGELFCLPTLVGV